MAIKPTTPVYQTSHPLAVNNNNYWLFQGDGTDLKGNNNFSVIDTGGTSITWPTDGDEGQVVDRNSDDNSDRLSLGAGIVSGTKWSVAGRLYARNVASYGSILSPGLFVRKSGGDPKYHYEIYNALFSSIPGIDYSTYSNFVVTYDSTATPKWNWYINGVLQTSGNDTISSITFLSALSDASNNELDGRISMLGIWLNRELTLGDVVILNDDPFILGREAETTAPIDPESTVTGLINGYCTYHHIQTDSSALIDEAGKIDYELSLSSGTGIGQVNKVWYKDRTVVSSDTIDLLNLPFQRLGFDFTASFAGAGSANIKGIHIENSSSANIGVKLPFERFNSSYFIVPPSGNIVLSNIRGWSVSPTGSVIQVSGNGSSQQYNIALIGSTLPIFIDNTSMGIPIEYKASSQFEKTVNIEFNKMAISAAGLIPFEYLSIPSGSSLSNIPIEYLAIASGSGSPNWENKALFNSDRFVNLEWAVSGIGPSGSGSNLIRNNLFLFDSTANTSCYGICDTSGLPPWQFIWPTGTFIQMPDLQMYELTSDKLFLIKRLYPIAPDYTTYETNKIVLNPLHGVRWQRFEISINQEIINIQSGITYKIEFNHELNNNGSYNPAPPQFNIYSKNRALLYNQSFNYATGFTSEHVTNYITAIDNGFVVEWKVPQQPSIAADPISWQENTYDVSVVWEIDTPTMTQS